MDSELSLALPAPCLLSSAVSIYQHRSASSEEHQLQNVRAMVGSGNTQRASRRAVVLSFHNRRGCITVVWLCKVLQANAAPHNSSKCLQAPPPLSAATVHTGWPGSSQSWCRRWWHSPESGTQWRLSLLSPQTLGSESRTVCTGGSVPAAAPWQAVWRW